ncbi:hypothetical protein C8R43DRAFT_1111210 [Mycena crocata]|nr:hypothetical protein C8R43DRAFT_1111210 [Mycena crocata]
MCTCKVEAKWAEDQTFRTGGAPDVPNGRRVQCVAQRTVRPSREKGRVTGGSWRRAQPVALPPDRLPPDVGAKSCDWLRMLNSGAILWQGNLSLLQYPKESGPGAAYSLFARFLAHNRPSFAIPELKRITCREDFGRTNKFPRTTGLVLNIQSPRTLVFSLRQEHLLPNPNLILPTADFGEIDGEYIQSQTNLKYITKDCWLNLRYFPEQGRASAALTRHELQFVNCPNRGACGLRPCGEERGEKRSAIPTNDDKGFNVDASVTMYVLRSDDTTQSRAAPPSMHSTALSTPSA